MKSMCTWCQRAPRQPHLGNCPELTGIQPRSHYGTRHRKDTYLRRPRENNGKPLPFVLYLVENNRELDTPADFYRNELELVA